MNKKRFVFKCFRYVDRLVLGFLFGAIGPNNPTKTKAPLSPAGDKVGIKCYENGRESHL